MTDSCLPILMVKRIANSMPLINNKKKPSMFYFINRLLDRNLKKEENLMY